MPITVHRDPVRGWILAKAQGPLDIEDILRIIGSVRVAVEQRMVPLLFDARQATGTIPESDIERAVEAVRAAVQSGGTRGHVAIVAPDDGVYAGMLRYETRCAAINVRVIRVFRQLPDAEQWLGIVSAARNLH